MTKTQWYPLSAAAIARPTPVFPEVGSTIVPPGFSSPSRSAASIIASPIRSFTDPPGFRYSSFARIRGPPAGEIASSRTIGVRPTRSRTVGYSRAMAEAYVLAGRVERPILGVGADAIREAVRPYGVPRGRGRRRRARRAHAHAVAAPRSCSRLGSLAVLRATDGRPRGASVRAGRARTRLAGRAAAPAVRAWRGVGAGHHRRGSAPPGSRDDRVAGG